MRHATVILLCVMIFSTAALMSCSSGGDTIDGFITESVSLYGTEETTFEPDSPNDWELQLYERIKGYFKQYYDEIEYRTSFDPSERESYGGDECYVFRSYTGDGEEGLQLAASVNGLSIYGYDPVTDLQGLVWCEGWLDPDFSYFWKKDISGL